MSQEFPMTPEGKKALEEELDHLIKVEREDLKVAIAEARALGDLKENAEYHAAKEKQSHIEGRIMELQSKVGRAKVVDITKITVSTIVFGATVKLINAETEQEKTYKIVGEEEADSKLGKISYSSPIARALIGKGEGDEVIVKAPKGDIEYEVVTVQYI
ncbi:MAG: transcription elongation factor GreA [Bacteriovoracaceae bacterium]|jgi:transcription elongation factor GreA|nr:transcription elongation factor GreA [Bacteriovoracaceae bacterium]